MLRVRVIPCLLWKNGGLVKTVKFKHPTYVGDATNAIRIFNEKEVDELMLLDIEASKKGNSPNIDLIKQIASECFMPLCYGGAVTTLEQIREVLFAGVEKVSINTKAVEDPAFIRRAAETYGSSTIVVCIDYKKTFLKGNVVTSRGGTVNSKYDPMEFALLMEEMGAGEVVLNSIDRDGTMNGYDHELLHKITEKLSIPVIALGGARNLAHIGEVVRRTKVSAVAAGSMFVFQGPHKAVLISYPKRKELEQILQPVESL
jgi:imidazole glycerol-phosphate synthase subunit HisF